MTGERQYVTTVVAARAIGVDRDTLRRWWKAGRVTPAFVTAAGHARWDVDQLREQFRAQETRMPESVDTPIDRAIASAIVTSARGVLVAERLDGKPPWTFIGGRIEPGESPADAAVREVKEEAGLNVRVSAAHVIGQRIHPATGRTMIYLACEPTEGTDLHNGDPAENAQVTWLPLAEAEEKLVGMYEPVHAYLRRALSKS